MLAGTESASESSINSTERVPDLAADRVRLPFGGELALWKNKSAMAERIRKRSVRWSRRLVVGFLDEVPVALIDIHVALAIVVGNRFDFGDRNRRTLGLHWFGERTSERECGSERVFGWRVPCGHYEVFGQEAVLFSER